MPACLLTVLLNDQTIPDDKIWNVIASIDRASSAPQRQPAGAAHRGGGRVRGRGRVRAARHAADRVDHAGVVPRPRALRLVHDAVQPESRLRAHDTLHAGGGLPPVSDGRVSSTIISNNYSFAFEMPTGQSTRVF